MDARSRPYQGVTAVAVDSEWSGALALRELMAPLGFRVACAAGGEHGVRLAEKTNPGIIVLAVDLPGMDGWSVLRHLRLHPILREVPVIMFSSSDPNQMPLTLDGVGFVQQPVSHEALLASIRTLTRSSTPSCG